MQAFSQDNPIGKGSKIVSGSFGYTRQSGNLYISNNNSRSITTISLTPSFSSFVTSHLALGFTLGYVTMRTDATSYESIEIGPQLALYFGNSNSTNFPFLHLGIKYESTNSYLKGSDIYFGFGILMPIKKNLGLTVEANYEIKQLYYPDNTGVNGNVLSIGVGICGLLFK